MVVSGQELEMGGRSDSVCISHEDEKARSPAAGIECPLFAQSCRITSPLVFFRGSYDARGVRWRDHGRVRANRRPNLSRRK